MSSPLRAMINKEVRQILRDRRTLMVLLLLPGFMLILFGYALSFDLKNISMGVCDMDKSEGSRSFIENFLHSGYFKQKYYMNSYSEIEDLLNRGEILTALVIPEKFMEDLTDGQSVNVQFVLDGSDANTANTALGYIEGFTGNFSGKISAEYLSMPPGTTTSLVNPEPRIWYNPSLDSAIFFVPGLIGFILMITTVISTSLSVVREKERNTMEQLIASPITARDIIVGKAIPYIFISLFAAFAILVIGYFLFDVTVQGSLWWLFISTLIFITAGLAIGLFISTLVNSQQVAFFIAVITTLLPTFIISGFIFPIDNMPKWVQVITHLVPARYYLEALRAIILKGVGIAVFWPNLLALCAFILVFLGISIKKLRRKEL